MTMGGEGRAHLEQAISINEAHDHRVAVLRRALPHRQAVDMRQAHKGHRQGITGRGAQGVNQQE